MLQKLANLMKMNGANVMQVTVKNKQTDEVIAEGQIPNNVFKFEGNWYFDEEKVDMANLQVTERTYTCSYKGTCFWVDLTTPAGTVQSVGWVYREPKDGYENIKDRIAFYAGTRQGTIAIAE